MQNLSPLDKLVAAAAAHPAGADPSVCAMMRLCPRDKWSELFHLANTGTFAEFGVTTRGQFWAVAAGWDTASGRSFSAITVARMANHATADHEDLRPWYAAGRRAWEAAKAGVYAAVPA